MEWYRATLEEVEKRLATDSHVGLSDNESKSRLSTYGYNRLPEIKADSLFTIFIRQFQSPLIYILIVASAIVFYIGDIADALIIIFVLIFNAVVGTLQEGKAQNTLEALREFTHTTANVLRNGREKVIPEEEVVSGDVLVLEEGEKVSADARIIESNSLRVDESALTGESGPIEKTASVILEINSYPAEAENMVFKGTGVLRGSGRAVVVATGVDSFIGKISVAVASIDTEIPLSGFFRELF
jgi:P-type Ca2+ transporter type 2C